MKFKGLGVALVTPFDHQLNVDFTALKNLIEHLIINGVDYLVMLGTTGESVTLNSKEKRRIIDTAIEVNNGRIKTAFRAKDGYGECSDILFSLSYLY